MKVKNLDVKNYFKNKVLTIAGSDCSGGAGIQADLKTYMSLGCYGMSVITAITAQNTQGVFDVMVIPLKMIENQLNAIFEDIDVNIIKIGMIYDANIINLVSDILKKNSFYKENIYNKKIILDPVMIAKSGSSLFKDEALNALKNQLIPMSFLITPNADEVIRISSCFNDIDDIKNEKDVFEIGKSILSLGCKNVLIKGGHLLFQKNESIDYLINQDMNSFQDMKVFQNPRIDTKNTHGTGCTLSSAIASFLSKGYDLEESIKQGKDFLTQCLINAKDCSVGKGYGPLNHYKTFF
jgi:hydroxymethylpyrimidine/phosphomethylpyrimidine kinase